jgi:hypothetical protein
MSSEPSAIPNLPPKPTATPSVPPRRLRLPGHNFWAICFALFAFEIGVFLTVFPWMDSWALNHLPTFWPSVEGIWDDAYFKGALSGLGLVNVYIALFQVIHLIRRRAQSRI